MVHKITIYTKENRHNDLDGNSEIMLKELENSDLYFLSKYLVACNSLKFDFWQPLNCKKSTFSSNIDLIILKL